MGWRVSYPQVVGFLGSGSVNVGEAILVHNPIGFDSFRCFPGVENQSLFNSKCFGLSNGLIRPGRFPVPGSGRPVRPWTVWIFSVPWREEIPLLFAVQSQFCSKKSENNYKLNNSNKNIRKGSKFFETRGFKLQFLERNWKSENRKFLNLKVVTEIKISNYNEIGNLKSIRTVRNRKLPGSCHGSNLYRSISLIIGTASGRAAHFRIK